MYVNCLWNFIELSIHVNTMYAYIDSKANWYNKFSTKSDLLGDGFYYNTQGVKICEISYVILNIK